MEIGRERECVSVCECVCVSSVCVRERAVGGRKIYVIIWFA